MGRQLVLCGFLLGTTIGGVMAQETDAPVEAAYLRTYNDALQFARQQAYGDAYDAFEAVIPQAAAAGDTAVVARTRRVLAQLDYHHGRNALVEGNDEDALRHFDRGIDHDPSFAPNREWRARTLERLGREEG